MTKVAAAQAEVEAAKKTSQAEATAARMADELIEAEEQEAVLAQARTSRKGKKARQKERKQVPAEACKSVC